VRRKAQGLMAIRMAEAQLGVPTGAEMPTNHFPVVQHRQPHAN
jgi:hypothetical protein